MNFKRGETAITNKEFRSLQDDSNISDNAMPLEMITGNNLRRGKVP